MARRRSPSPRCMMSRPASLGRTRATLRTARLGAVASIHRALGLFHRHKRYMAIFVYSILYRFIHTCMSTMSKPKKKKKKKKTNDVISLIEAPPSHNQVKLCADYTQPRFPATVSKIERTSNGMASASGLLHASTSANRAVPISVSRFIDNLSRAWTRGLPHSSSPCAMKGNSVLPRRIGW